MKTKINPFPHKDGSPASWQDVQDQKQLSLSMAQTRKAVERYAKMIVSTMK